MLLPKHAAPIYLAFFGAPWTLSLGHERMIQIHSWGLPVSVRTLAPRPTSALMWHDDIAKRTSSTLYHMLVDSNTISLQPVYKSQIWERMTSIYHSHLKIRLADCCLTFFYLHLFPLQIHSSLEVQFSKGLIRMIACDIIRKSRLTVVSISALWTSQVRIAARYLSSVLSFSWKQKETVPWMLSVLC